MLRVQCPLAIRSTAVFLLPRDNFWCLLRSNEDHFFSVLFPCVPFLSLVAPPPLRLGPWAITLEQKTRSKPQRMMVMKDMISCICLIMTLGQGRRKWLRCRATSETYKHSCRHILGHNSAAKAPTWLRFCMGFSPTWIFNFKAPDGPKYVNKY